VARWSVGVAAGVPALHVVGGRAVVLARPGGGRGGGVVGVRAARAGAAVGVVPVARVGAARVGVGVMRGVGAVRVGARVAPRC